MSSRSHIDAKICIHGYLNIPLPHTHTGKMFNPTGAVKDLMHLVDATSDPIESFFGIHDLVATTMSKNTSFHVTSTLATWRHNRTTKFLHTLTPVQLDLLLHSAVKHGKLLKRESDKRDKKAAIHKLKYLEKQARETRESEKKLIKDLFCMRDETLFKTTTQYQAFVTSVDDDYKKILKELKRQIRILRKVVHACVCTRVCIMVSVCMASVNVRVVYGK